MEGNSAVSIFFITSSSIRPCWVSSSKGMSFRLGSRCSSFYSIDSSIPIENGYLNMNDIKTIAVLHVPCELGSADSATRILGLRRLSTNQFMARWS
jgi:hypothetical protein